jgi:hypothetical protein
MHPTAFFKPRYTSTVYSVIPRIAAACLFMQDIGRGTDRYVAARCTIQRLFLAGPTALLADPVGIAVLVWARALREHLPCLHLAGHGSIPIESPIDRVRANAWRRDTPLPEQIDLREVDELLASTVNDGTKHEQPKVVGLVSGGHRRHHEFLACAHNVDKSRARMGECFA